MEEKTYDLCLQVLQRLRDAGALDQLILVGSWCLLPYEDHFGDRSHLPAIRTRDIEFLVPGRAKFPRKVDLAAHLKDLGFIVDYKGTEGYIVFQHPELILEFLAPEHGRGRNKPQPVPDLGINAQPMRFMDLLANSSVAMCFGGIEVRVPSPACFALQKLLIAGRRKNRDKAEKDRAQAVGALRSLRAIDELQTARSLLTSMPPTWQRTVRRELTELDEHALLLELETSGEEPTGTA